MAITPFRMAMWHFTVTLFSCQHHCGHLSLSSIPTVMKWEAQFYLQFWQNSLPFGTQWVRHYIDMHAQTYIYTWFDVWFPPSELHCLLSRDQTELWLVGHNVSVEATLHSAAQINIGHHRTGSLSWNKSIFESVSGSN